MGFWFSKPEKENPAMTRISHQLEQERRQKQELQRRAEAEERKLEDARTAQRDQEAALQDLRERHTRGIRPVVWPSEEEFEATKARYQYLPDNFHVAIAGISGTGKSSLINSFRGLHGRDANAAKVSVVEGTMTVDRYTQADKPLVWFDIPGAGTLSCPDWTYFNDLGLYVFDTILIVWDNRFSATDVAIITNCIRYCIPFFVVRSKADQHVRNVYLGALEEAKASKGGKVLKKQKKSLWADAQRAFEDATRESISKEMEKAGLPAEHPAYIVSAAAMLQQYRKVVGQVEDEDEDEDEFDPMEEVMFFDEEKLMARLAEETYRQRTNKDSRWIRRILASSFTILRQTQAVA